MVKMIDTNNLLIILGMVIGAFIIRWLDRNIFSKNRYTRRKK
tara:strand:+ start:1197 stop:1322 length:126 start_codon:yes stop_codon:yes gene_type:complete